MSIESGIQKALEESIARAASRGFTHEYQKSREEEENTISRRKLTPATLDKYDYAVKNWALWRLSRNEAVHTNFSKDEPDPSPILLKSFMEFYVASRKKVPSQQSTCHHFISFTSKWERETERSLSVEIKDDVLNYIRNELTPKYDQPTKPRERYLVTADDMVILQNHLFVDDCHDYKHERARVQIGSSLSLFAGSAARAGSIVESSAYRKSNECLLYKHLKLQIKWSRKDDGLMRWVTIDPEFLKGVRYRDDKNSPKNWFNEHPVLGMSFVFWVIAQGVADGAFKGLETVDQVLAARPPKGRESWTLHWNQDAANLPFYRMVTLDGPHASKGLTFGSLHHNYTSLAQRACFRNRLRVHGIRGAVANKIDSKASEATRGQALDHQNPDTYLKYQSQLKAVDIQAAYFGFEPDYECRDMELSMAHHRDLNAPQKLDAATVAQFQKDEEVIALDEKIRTLTVQIAGNPDAHRDLVLERSRLYTRKAKRLRTWKSEFVENWWETSYDEYISGNEFLECDETFLFEIVEKYIPERARLRVNLFKEAKLDSEVGRQCLEDIVSICKSTERTVYYPGLTPVEGCCPLCSKTMSDIALQGRAKHILQCQRKSLGGAPYQQSYKNNKRAHRKVRRQFVQFCYMCAAIFQNEHDWIQHCQSHLSNLKPRCGVLKFRYTLVASGFCPFCLGDATKPADGRFQQWLDKATLLNHIDAHISSLQLSTDVSCPHPCCENKVYADASCLRRHFHDAHSIEEPRSNCVKRKRKWHSEPELDPEPQPAPAHLEIADNWTIHMLGINCEKEMPVGFEGTRVEELMREFIQFDESLD